MDRNNNGMMKVGKDIPDAVIACTAVGDEEGRGIYLFGGRDSSGKYNNRAYYYDGDIDDYKDVKSIPCDCGYGVGGRLSEGRIWLATGDPDDWLLVYDKSKNEWEILDKAVGIGIGPQGVAGKDDTIHLFGGDKYRIYNMKKEERVDRSNEDVKEERVWRRSDRYFVYGGRGGGEEYKDMIIYDAEEKEWARGKNMPSINFSFSSAYDEEGRVVIGGYNFVSGETYDTISE